MTEGTHQEFGKESGKQKLEEDEWSQKPDQYFPATRGMYEELEGFEEDEVEDEF